LEKLLKFIVAKTKKCLLFISAAHTRSIYVFLQFHSLLMFVAFADIFFRLSLKQIAIMYVLVTDHSE